MGDGSVWIGVHINGPARRGGCAVPQQLLLIAEGPIFDGPPVKYFVGIGALMHQRAEPVADFREANPRLCEGELIEKLLS
jgi:hypothetical protein